MFTKKQYLDILNWVYSYILQKPNIYLLQQVPVTGVIDYSVGDLIRAMKKFRGDAEVVRAYEKVRELLSLRLIENKELELAVKNKLLEDFLADTKVTGLGEVVNEERLSDKELEKRMKELGWVRL